MATAGVFWLCGQVTLWHPYDQVPKCVEGNSQACFLGARSLGWAPPSFEALPHVRMEQVNFAPGMCVQMEDRGIAGCLVRWDSGGWMASGQDSTKSLGIRCWTPGPCSRPAEVPFVGGLRECGVRTLALSPSFEGLQGWL
jgi:hypothetical protein